MRTESPGCGGCHQWGYDPNIVDGRCDTCERTLDELREFHGFVFLAEVGEHDLEDLRQRIWADRSEVLMHKLPGASNDNG